MSVADSVTVTDAPYAVLLQWLPAYLLPSLVWCRKAPDHLRSSLDLPA